jgi:hypothetical protein
MAFLSDPRHRSIALFGAGALLVFILLGALQAFNTSNISFLNPETSGETLAFTGLTVVVFLLFIILLMLLLRNILKLVAEQSSGALGARLRTRMVLGAALIALIPAVFMFLFSFQLMNRSIDRWFSPNTSELHDDSTRVVQELVQYVGTNARSESESIATSGATDRDLPQLQDVLASRRITLEGGFVVVYDKNKGVLASYQAPPLDIPVRLHSWTDAGMRDISITMAGPLSSVLLSAAQRSDEPVIEVAGQQYALGLSITQSGKAVVAALPMPQGLSQTVKRIRTGADEYWRLFHARSRLRTTFFLMLLLITTFVFFSSVWLAVFLSKQITRPVEALADAMNAIADGKYDQRVETRATGEMGDLVASFNHMAADLETSRNLAESSSAQLTTANQALEERRRELETVLETIPNGVVTLDASGTVLQSNHAFTSLLGLHEISSLAGEPVETILPPECIVDFSGVIRRSRRMGMASTEVEFHSAGRVVHLAITCARLDLAPGRAGSVLVVEDTTELLRAQRQLAWKEVAQRVAHEIKNPLTPIALSAERIRRHLDRTQTDSPKIIRKCSEVILGCVETLRGLVDQFGALAQFPAHQPHLCEVNQLAESALALFADRLDGITLQRHLQDGLPQVMADPDAMRRSLANLIDNAAEAMQDSLLKVLTISSSVCDDGSSVEICITDTGHGLTDEIRERLFLPFYSTKQRGTGLGLSIAAKIVQEHGGSIRAESNTPKGARFFIHLPLTDPCSPPSAPDALVGESNLYPPSDEKEVSA